MFKAKIGDLVVALYKNQTIMGRIKEDASGKLYIESDGIVAFLDEVPFVSKATIVLNTIYYCKNGALYATPIVEGKPDWKSEYVVKTEGMSKEDINDLRKIARKVNCKLQEEKMLTLTENLTFSEVKINKG